MKFSPSSEAALLEYGNGGTPAAQTHLLLPECGGSKMIFRHRSRPQEVSRGLHILWTRTLLTGALARLGEGEGVTWMSAQDRRSTALKLPWEMGPQQGPLCQQEGGNHSLPTFFPSALPTLNNKDYFCRPCVQVSRIWPTGSTADGLIAREKHTHKSNALAQLCGDLTTAALCGV